MMEELKELLRQLVGNEGDYFRALTFGGDPNTFAVSLDEVEELPAVGCLAMRTAEVDITGQSCIAFQLFFLVKREEDATPEEWDAVQTELIKEMHCLCARLRPYVWRYPQRFNHFSDHAVTGYWCDFTASAVQLAECVNCQPSPTPPVPPGPEPPIPEGEYFDRLTAVNGVNGGNIFILPVYDFNKETKTKIKIEIADFGGTSQIKQCGLFECLVKASAFGSRSTDFGVTYSRYDNYILLDFENDTYEGVVTTPVTRSLTINYGSTHRFGVFRLFGRKIANDTATQSISGVKVWQNDEIRYDLKPFKTTAGVVGLKDTISGEFFAPQYNDTITAENDE